MAREPISSTVLADGQKQFYGTESSNVYAVLFRAATLTGVFRDLLTRHFASEDTIEAPELKRLIWKNNPTTEILIESVWRWNPQQSGIRPAVMLRRRQCVPQRIGMGGERKQFPSTDTEGNPHYMTMWTGSHVAFCIANEPGQTEALATEVMRELHQFGQKLVECGVLVRCAIAEYGEMAQVEGAKDQFVVPVTIGYSFEDSWKICTQAPRLSNISLTAILNC